MKVIEPKRNIKDPNDKKDSKKAKNKTKIPKTVQDTIPYDGMLSNGLMQLKPGLYSKTYLLEDINFKQENESEQETIVLDYGDFLNSINESMTAKITIFNRVADQETVRNNILIKPQKDSLNKYRDEMNNVVLNKMAKGKNNITQEKYLTITVSADSPDLAETIYSRVDVDVSKKLGKINKKIIKPLNDLERFAVIHDIYNPDSEISFIKKSKNFVKEGSFDYKKIARTGLTTKDLVAPMSIRVHPDYMEIDGKFARTMILDNYPTFLHCDILPDLASLSCNLLVSATYKTMLPDKAIKLVKNRRTNITSNVVAAESEASKKGYSPENISFELRRTKKEADELMDDIMSRNQKILFATVTMTLFADSMRELDSLTESMKSVAVNHLCQAKTLFWQQEAAFNTSLPFSDLYLEIDRLLTTEGASAFIPFSVQELNQANGKYYGVNAISGNLIYYNRLSSENYNGMIFGKPGSGKSMIAKIELSQVSLGTKDEIIIVDPQCEYTPLVKAFGGEVLNVNAGSKTHLNPLDMDMQYSGDDKDPVAMKCDFLVSLCETISNQPYGLTAGQIAVINRYGRKIYEPYLKHMKNIMEENKKKPEKDQITIDREAMPTLMDFYNALQSSSDTEALELSLILEPYCNGNYDLFSHPTNINSDARIISYNVKDLSNVLKELGYQVCLNDAWNRIINNKKKGIKTWLYIDEMHLLMQKDSTVNFLKEIFKLARKFGGIPTGITQNAEDVLTTAEARSMIQNCDFVVIMNQSSIDRTELSDLYGISDSLLEYITDQPFGTGLIYNAKTIVPFINEFDTDTELYRLMSTKATEDVKQ